MPAHTNPPNLLRIYLTVCQSWPVRENSI